MPHSTTYSPVAITGVHGRFPRAQDVNQFWQNLLSGKDCITQVSGERGVWQSPSEADTQTYYAGFMPHPDKFDQRFFGVLPKEAETMDPMQRIFLQTAWNALEDAGYDPTSLAGQKVGVFVGVGHADYPVLMQEAGVPIEAYHGTGIALTSVANKVSFFFDFHGPSQSIDTACSSSLIAMHRAANSLHNKECDLAIVGGINLLLGPELFHAFSQASMLSPAGRCHTFDKKADGYVRGEGVGAIVLRPLKQAQVDKDHIYAVLSGSAENHGGRAHSFTAPNVNAQAEVICSAWQAAGLTPSDADLIESHGTGTPLGDPIEINAIKKAVADPSKKIAIGALKSHIGHLEAAAGIAGIIKTLMSFQHKTLPANLHFNQLNPHIALEDSGLFFPEQAMQLSPSTTNPIRAGVSSFGFGGVNAHVVLESYTQPKVKIKTEKQANYLIPISAHDDASLNARVIQLVRILEQDPALQRAALKKQLSQVICTAFNIAAEQRTSTLQQLAVTPNQWLNMITKINQKFALTVSTEQLAGCQTVIELTQRLTELSQGCNPTAQAQHLLCDSALSTEKNQQLELSTLAATLLVGRKQLTQRLAIICQNKEELLQQLRDFLSIEENQHPATASYFIGRAKNAPIPEHLPKLLLAFQQNSDTKEALGQLAENWVSNKKLQLEWDNLYPQLEKPAKHPLPAYPFKLNRVWFKQIETPEPATAQTSAPLTHWLSLFTTTPDWPNSLASVCTLLTQLPEPFNSLSQLQLAAPKELPNDVQLALLKRERGKDLLLQVAAPNEPNALVQGLAHQQPITTATAHEWTQLTRQTPLALYEKFAQTGVRFATKELNLKSYQESSESLLLEFCLTPQDSFNYLLNIIWAHSLAAIRLLSQNPTALIFKVGLIKLHHKQCSSDIQVQIFRLANSHRFEVRVISKQGRLLVMKDIEIRNFAVQTSTNMGEVA